MFRVASPATVSLPVEVQPPAGAGAPGACTVDVRYLGVQGRRDALRRIADEGIEDRRILEERIVGWDGIEDEQGAHLDYNDRAVRDRVLDVPWVYEAILAAVLTDLGIGEAAAKNS